MKKVKRHLRFEGKFAFIPLSCGLDAKIDAEDAQLVEALTWHALKQGPHTYAIANVRKQSGIGWTTVRLHRLILGLLSHDLVDHKNGDGLDCTRENLRPATNAQNARNMKRHKDNKSGFKGVSWHGGARKWRASIMVSGKKMYLGFFETREAAHERYCLAAKEHHQEFARFS